MYPKLASHSLDSQGLLQSLELLILCLLSDEITRRLEPPCLPYAVLGIEPRAQRMLGEYPVTPPALAL